MSVVLEKWMAEDVDVTNAARVSFGKHVLVMTDADTGVLDYMVREEHGTPFEHNAFKFRVHTSLGVAREWFRHRMASYNERSTRYMTMPKEFYLHRPDQMRKQVGRAGRYTFEPVDAATALRWVEWFKYAYDLEYELYQEALGMQMPKELARNVLPLGFMTEFVWTINLRSLFNFMRLRAAPNALLELQEEARLVEELITPIMPVTMKLWNKHGRPKV